jgi:methyl-accepting chemotaxis protein
LFFTFVFLSLALVDATSALKPGVSSSKESEAAIQSLLNVAGGKFLTSLAGLLASILWTFSSKLTAKKLTRASDEFLDSLAKVVRQSGGEYVMLRELEISNERVELSRELLLETREQTGTFKRFETDLAVSLAGAINESFAPQLELMTSKLVTAIDSLSEKLGSMNQDALEKMTKDFSAMLQQNTETEMSQLRTTLQDLSSRLEGAGTVFGDGAKDAASAINEAGAQLVQRVQEISENLATGAINLDGAASSIKLAMNDLEVTVVEASNLGKKGVLVFNAALANASETVDKLSNASSGLAHASQAIESVGGKISDVVDTVEELSREQRAVVMAVKEVAPTALAAVERVSGVLNQAAQQTLGVMEQTKQSMETTANTLGRTVASITEGVTVYTDQVAQLHIKMDEQFAKAVGSFDKGVTELSESVEELAEVMQTRTKG